MDIPECPLPVYLVEGLSSPCLFGLFRPAIYLTPEAVENETVLRHVLAHEATHYAHKDHIWSALRCTALALHWYNPLVWLAVSLSKADRGAGLRRGGSPAAGRGGAHPLRPDPGGHGGLPVPAARRSAVLLHHNGRRK